MTVGDLGRRATAENLVTQSARFLLAKAEAEKIVSDIETVVRCEWEVVARAAKVTATIETKNGIVIRKLDQRTFGAGPQRLVWDGRTSGGGLSFSGAYVVRIAAENAVGEVELTQAFTARRS